MNKSKRLSLATVVALVALLMVALIGGTAADAKKKKKKQSNSVTATKTIPVGIPAAADLGGNNQLNSIVAIPLTIGKKAKGKLVAGEAPKVTYQLSGAAGSLNGINVRLTAPNGRTVGVGNPANAFDTGVGPVEISANSPVGACGNTPTPPPPPCEDPENTLPPPYVGILGNSDLAAFTGLKARGNWVLKFVNTQTTQIAVVNLTSIEIPVEDPPAAAK